MSKIYNIELYKKVLSDKTEESISGKASGVLSSCERSRGNLDIHPNTADYTVIGYFDRISVKTVEKFDEMTPEYVSTTLNHKRFLTYSLFCMTVSDSEEMILLDDRYKKNSIFIVSAFKLNFSAHIQHQSSKELFNDIRRRIKKKINRRTLQVLSCFGSFDILVICAGKSMKELMEIPHTIRTCVNDQNVVLFEHSTSFLVGHNELNHEKIKAEKVNASISLAFTSEAMIHQTIESLRGNFIHAMGQGGKRPDVKPYIILGDTDCQIVLENCPVRQLLKLYGIGSSFRKQNEACLLSTQNVWNEKNVKSSYIHVKTPYTSTAPNTPINTLQFSERENPLYELKKGFNRIKNLVPATMRHTLNILVDTCQCAVDSDPHKIMGLRVTRILNTAMRIINEVENTDKKKVPTETSQCLRDISLILPTAMQFDDIHIDHMDGEEFDIAGPTGKFLYGYEHLFREIFAKLYRINDNGLDKDLMIFLTIGHSSEINSVMYFRTPYVSKSAIFFSVNLPDASYFDPKKNAPYIYHEFSHYLWLRSQRTPRNEAFENFLHRYLILQIHHNMNEIVKSFCKKHKDPAVDFGEIYNVFNMALKVCGKIDLELKLDDLQEKWIDRIKRATKWLCDRTLPEIDGETAEPHFILKQICYELNSALANVSFVQELADMLLESRADVIMAGICDLSASDYLIAMYNHMVRNRIDSADDIALKYRYATILLVLLPDGDGAISKCISELQNQSQKKYFEKTFEFLKNNSILLSPLAKYLKEELSLIPESIKDTLKVPCGKSKMPPDEVAGFLLDHWYASMKYWGGYDY